MSLADLGIEGFTSKTLLIDGDIVIYQPCCIFNNDNDIDRRQIIRHINNKIDKMLVDSGCDKYTMFVTTKFNFRNQIVDDYKANRKDVERPVNLVWAKRWAIQKLNTHFVKGLEADDLLGIHTDTDTVIWSLDKDLRQIPGEHLDDKTSKVINISEVGRLEEMHWVTEAGNKRKKIYFEGLVGLYFQMLIGDDTDHILGCAQRLDVVVKSGKNKGNIVNKRVGVGPKPAYEGILKAIMADMSTPHDESALAFVINEYKKLFKDNWQVHLETQANLLFMVRQQSGKYFRRWTFDGRKEYFNLETGKVLSLEMFKDERNKSSKSSKK